MFACAHPALDAIYATFAEGWSDPAGTDARQRNRAELGLWLGRVLASPHTSVS